MRRILLLVNSLFEARGKRYLSHALRVFEKAGINVEVQTSGLHRAAGEKTRHAIKQDIDAVIVCGGDGTVFDALQGMAGSDIPLGILPIGTGNILAQNLKIPSKPTEAAHWLLHAKPRSVPLGKITCCVPGGQQTWFFAMAAGLGNHAVMMQSAERYKRYGAGRAAYFAAGIEILCGRPVQLFDLKIMTAEGQVTRRRVSEMVAVRVAELNLWRPGGNLDFPFLRLATVESESRWRLVQASFEALFLNAGQRGRRVKRNAAAYYEDVLQVECKLIPDVKYRGPIPVEADGEILGWSCATIEMAGLNVRLLCSPKESERQSRELRHHVPEHPDLHGKASSLPSEY